MTEIFLELHDENGVVHDTFQTKFENEINLNLIKEKVQSVWQINEVYQRISNKNGNELFLSSCGLTHGSEIIVKHSELPRWVEYQWCVEQLIKKRRWSRETAQRAMKHHEILMEKSFFDTYIGFESYRRKHQPELARLADGGQELMVRAANRHFLIRHGLLGGTSECEMRFQWEPKSNDVKKLHTEIIADVQLHGENRPTKYAIKCLHSDSLYSNGCSSNIIIEMFSNKLLEVLGVGPEVQFILPATYTKASIYKASKWRDDFVCLSETSTFHIKALIQLRLLNVLLFIGDLHGHNCGQWKSTNTAAVVDIIPLSYTIFQDARRAVRAPFRLAWDDVPKKLLLECPQETFWEIVKDILEEWRLLERIEQANELITTEKETMKKLIPELSGFDRSYMVTEELDNHLDAIKINVAKIIEELNSDS